MKSAPQHQAGLRFEEEDHPEALAFHFFLNLCQRMDAQVTERTTCVSEETNQYLIVLILFEVDFTPVNVGEFEKRGLEICLKFRHGSALIVFMVPDWCCAHRSDAFIRPTLDRTTIANPLTPSAPGHQR